MLRKNAKEKCKVQFSKSSVPDSVKSTVEKKVKHLVQKAPHLVRCSFDVELPKKNRRIIDHFKVQVQIARKDTDHTPQRVASVTVHEEPRVSQSKN